MTDLVAEARALLDGDHKRGCDGRSYSCTCGHDEALDDSLRALADRCESLQEQLRVSQAWAADRRDRAAMLEAKCEALQRERDAYVAAVGHDRDEWKALLAERDALQRKLDDALRRLK